MLLKRALLFLAIIITLPVLAESTSRAVLLPEDSKLIRGTMENGMDYMIYPHANPKGQINLWLQIHAGSLLEEDDQQGVAHLVEHLLFNGTKDYPNNQVIEQLEKIGLRFGRDVNAYTSYNETVYHINMSAENKENINTVMNIFANWATLASFDPQELDGERGVVVEEWRTRQNVYWRFNQKRRETTLAGSRYLVRQPIGLVDIIKNISTDRVRDYYTRWYQPENMTFIISGDIDSHYAQNLITDTFSSITKQPVPDKENYSIPASDKTRLITLSDKEYPNNEISLMFRFPYVPSFTEESFIQNAKLSILLDLFNQRMNDLRQQGHLEALTIYAARSQLSNDYQSVYFIAEVKGDAFQAATQNLLAELQRLDRYGFTQTELDRQQKRHLIQLKNRMENEASQNSAAIAKTLAKHSLQDTPVLSLAEQYALYQKAYQALDAASLNDLWHTLHQQPDVIIEQVVAPQIIDNAFTLDSFLALVKTVRDTPLEPYTLQLNDSPLLASPPEAGTLLHEQTMTGNLTEIILSNGAKALIVPTTLDDTNVRIIALRRKGLLNLDDESYKLANIATRLVDTSGLSELSANELQDWQAEHLVNFATLVNPDYTTLSLVANHNQLTAAFELIHQRFMAAKINPDLIPIAKEEQKNSLKNKLSEPQSRYYQRLLEARFNDPRVALLTEAEIDQFTAEKLLALDKQIFSQANEFTFIIVGQVNPDEVKPMLATYIASLPNTTKAPAIIRPLVTTKESVQTIMNAGEMQYAEVNEFLSHPHYGMSERDRQSLLAFNFLLARDLRVQIREKASGVYGVYSNAAFNMTIPTFNYTMRFSCQPSRYDELLTLAKQVREQRIASGITQEELLEYQTMQKRAIMIQKSTNASIAALLTQSYLLHDSPFIYTEVEHLVDSLTTTEISAIGKAVFQADNISTIGVLLPETK